MSLITDAVNSWVDTGYGWNPLYAYRSYDYYNSNMDIYVSYVHVEGYIRGNIFYYVGDSSNATEIHPWDQNWVYTEVELFIEMYPKDDYNRMQRYIAHFFGSTFGLGTNEDSNSVMCSWYTPCNVYKPSLADHNGLNAIYNN